MKKLINLAALICLYAAAYAQNSPVKLEEAPNTFITIIYPELLAGEKLEFYSSGNTPLSNWKAGGLNVVEMQGENNGRYTFSCYTDSVNYIRIHKTGTKAGDHYTQSFELIDNYYIKKGDDVTVTIKKTNSPAYYDYFKALRAEFSGTGANHFRLQYQLDSLVHTCPDTTALMTTEGHYNPHNYINAQIRTAAAFADTGCTALTLEDHQRLLSNAVCSLELTRLKTVDVDIRWRMKRTKKTDFRYIWSEMMADTTTRAVMLSPAELIDNLDHLESKLRRIFIEAKIAGRSESPDSIFHTLIANYSGKLRDRLIGELFRNHYTSIKNFNQVYREAAQVVQDPYDRALINSYRNRIEGNPALDFALPDVKGQMVRLSDFKGKVVVMDFWFTGCQFCEAYYRDVLKQVEQEHRDAKDVVFITINVDKLKARWLKSVSGGKYTSLSVTNLYTNGEGMNSAVTKFYHISAFPQPMVISKDHRVISMNIDDLRDKTYLANLIERLRGEKK